MIINANEEEKKKQTLATKDRLISNNKEEKAKGLFDVATKKAYSPLAGFPCDKTYEELLQEGINIYGNVGHFDWYLFPSHCRTAGVLNCDIDEDEGMTKFFLNFSDYLFRKNNSIDEKYLDAPVSDEYKKNFTNDEINDLTKAPDISFAVCKKAVEQWCSMDRKNQRGIRFSKIVQYIDFMLRSLIYLYQVSEEKDMIKTPLKHYLIFVKAHIIDPYRIFFEKEIDDGLGSEGVYSLHDKNYKNNVRNLLGLFDFLDNERAKNKDGFDWVETAATYMNDNEQFKPGCRKNIKDKNVDNSVPKFTVKSDSGAIVYDPEGFSNHTTHHTHNPPTHYGGEGDHVNPNPPSGGISFTPKKTSFLEGIKTPLSSKSLQQHKLHEQKYLDKKRDTSDGEGNTKETPSIITDYKLDDDDNKKQQKNQFLLVFSVFFAVAIVVILTVIGVTSIRGDKSDAEEINNEVKDSLKDGMSLYV